MREAKLQHTEGNATSSATTGLRLQRRCDSGNHAMTESLEAPGIVHEVLNSSGQPLDGQTRDFMETGLGHDFSKVRVHADARAGASADAVSAEAYTVRNHVVFGTGKYRPATDDGRQLIAHELVHVLQQGEGPVPSQMSLGSESSPLEHQADSLSADAMAMFGHRESHGAGLPALDVPVGTIQRRRVPENVGLQAATPISGPGFDATRDGLARLLSRAWAELSVANQTAVQTAMGSTGLTWTTEADLRTALSTATRNQLVQLGREIRTAEPTAELGSPLLIDTGARPGTTDAANISTLVTNANTIFATLATTTRDADLTEVFGAGNEATAKTKYSNAKTQMEALQRRNKIVTDRSGYSGEVGLGGLSNADQISVEPSVIDNPTDDESVVTLIHESMHAGNSDVHDFGYIDQPSFTVLDEPVKLTNAAHFEVVPRRILGAANAFTGVTFTPAGTGGTPALTSREQAIRDASEAYRAAWTVGLNLHTLFVRLFRTPSEWNTLDLSTEYSGAPAGVHFADTLPFWSKVERLTMHTRPVINPVGLPDEQPVTLIDIALSEGLIRKLSQGMNSVPATPADALALETASASVSERTAATVSVAAERDLLIRLVIRVNLGSITGSIGRDERVVARMAQADLPDFTDMLAIHPLSSFP